MMMKVKKKCKTCGGTGWKDDPNWLKGLWPLYFPTPEVECPDCAHTVQNKVQSDVSQVQEK